MSEEVMDDHEFLSALEQLHATEDSDVAELLSESTIDLCLSTTRKTY